MIPIEKLLTKTNEIQLEFELELVLLDVWMSVWMYGYMDVWMAVWMSVPFCRVMFGIGFAIFADKSYFNCNVLL